jgi:hypothetical protein
MGTRMKAWLRATALVLVTSGCNDEPAASDGAAAPPPATTPAAGEREQEHEGIVAHEGGHAADDGGGGGLFLKKERVEPTPPSHPGGFTGLTRELIEKARHTVGDPVQLVPDVAQYMARVRPAVLLGHAEARAAWTKAEESDPSIKIAMDVTRACLGRIEAIDDVVVGFDDAKQLVVIVHAKGLGTEATWKCLQTETTARGRPFELAVTGTPRGSGPQLESTEAVGWLPDDDTAVIASKAWTADMEARMRGEGTAAVAGALAATMKRIQVDDPAWLAGRVTGVSASALTGSPFSGIDDLAIDMRLDGEDLVIATSFDAGESADATRLRDETQQQVDQMKSMLPLLGFPASVGPKLSFVADGELMKLDLTLTRDELRALREGIERSF